MDKREKWQIEADNAYRKEAFSKYDKDRDKLHDAALELGDRFDKAALAYGGGAFVLSMTFVEKIVPNPSPICIIILAISWIALGISCVSSLFALAYSQRATHHQIGLLDRFYEPILFPDSPQVENESDTETNPFSEKVKLCNEVSRCSLAVGLSFIVIFAILCLINRGTKNDRQAETQPKSCSETCTTKTSPTASPTCGDTANTCKAGRKSTADDRTWLGIRWEDSQGLLHPAEELFAPTSHN